MVLSLKISVTLFLLVQLLPTSSGFPSGCGCGCCGCCCGGCGSPPPPRQNGGCSSQASQSVARSIGHTTFRPPIFPHAATGYCEDNGTGSGYYAGSGGKPTNYAGGSYGGQPAQSYDAGGAYGGQPTYYAAGGGEGSEAHQRSGVKGYLKGKPPPKGPRPTLPPEIAKHPSSLSPPQLETYTNPSVKSGAPDYSG